MILERIPLHPEPKPELEQYTTPTRIAADVLYFAHSMGDIQGRKVVDLGCGTGIFAIGAALLGAEEAVGIDIDERAIEAAKRASEELNVKARFLVSNVMDFEEKGHCVLQNPPFGAQKKHADRPFIRKALEISSVVYSLHLTQTRDFVEREAERNGAEVTHRKTYEFEIGYTFEFHSKEKESFDVTLFRMEKMGE
ncbi:MAG: 50S ribosomal protein L11 methyltransferase [Thermoplasmata archaeon]|nr:MAG: 50S ribosomal protein L11 methyltransferase [Thermoplasmata archaeon]